MYVRGNKKPLYTLKGRWDTEVMLTNCETGVSDVYFNVATAEVLQVLYTQH